MTQYMSKNEWSSWKRKLTIAKKKSPEAVIEVCNGFFAREDEGVCLPDDWHRFNIAREDAQFDLRRNQHSILRGF